MAEKFRFPDAKQLASIFGVSEQVFHRRVKPRIKSDFSRELQIMNTGNPDVGVDENFCIVLRHPESGAILQTGVPLHAYQSEQPQ
jgi:hypothetical protein